MYVIGNDSIVQFKQLEMEGPKLEELSSMMMEILLKLIERPEMSSKV